ncbi:MAG TPA: lipoate--protein ligase family protein [Geobacteraceae bacterium]|nr:lipoate--protein ligase family protein [Geobacteraceae bacterium]
MTVWRFIDSGALDGAMNMAVDEALLRCFDPRSSLPVFRIYGWEPPALSLGRFQKGHDVLDRKRCDLSGVPVVRRITGGGTIYHADELTYSLVCAPRHVPPAASIKESFRVLTSFLIRFYTGLGLDARYAVEHFPSGTGFGERTAFCFAGKESYDIIVSGRKIGGNAQRRLRDIIFQHGSIPMVNHAAVGAEFLRDPPARIRETTFALGDAGVTSDRKELQGLMAQSFAESMPALLHGDSLTPEEEKVAVSLYGQKHAQDSWIWEGLDKE